MEDLIIKENATISFVSCWKKYEIDYSKIKSLEDVILILKSINFQLMWGVPDVPEKI